MSVAFVCSRSLQGDRLVRDEQGGQGITGRPNDTPRDGASLTDLVCFVLGPCVDSLTGGGLEDDLGLCSGIQITVEGVGSIQCRHTQRSRLRGIGIRVLGLSTSNMVHGQDVGSDITHQPTHRDPPRGSCVSSGRYVGVGWQDGARNRQDVAVRGHLVTEGRLRAQSVRLLQEVVRNREWIGEWFGCKQSQHRSILVVLQQRLLYAAWYCPVCNG